ncbi:uncharacterized protein ATNIH1004_001980 [Aspergillus tanneri]|uniref:Uncharacterized protein n=1 Tax=Aspergillus tanneri TaxID=1220188 RepID=A0A5M9M3Q7_9EURO|nr:uncharacterized protein ATNIH1004_001980 [Aspergillus tanneri]KAA8641378.1 hypothetical protein ATNIH1004_001980 [Aspergillus tanneri]
MFIAPGGPHLILLCATAPQRLREGSRWMLEATCISTGLYAAPDGRLFHLLGLGMVRDDESGALALIAASLRVLPGDAAAVRHVSQPQRRLPAMTGGMFRARRVFGGFPAYRDRLHGTRRLAIVGAPTRPSGICPVAREFSPMRPHFSWREDVVGRNTLGKHSRPIATKFCRLVMHDRRYDFQGGYIPDQ